MPFISNARREISSRPVGDPIRITLEFLIANAIGQANAVPISNVLMHLSNRGVVMRYNQFQQLILGASRHSDYFIGSGTRGVYLIATIEDARAMRDFYGLKIQTQQQNLNHLLAATQGVGWQI